MHSDLGPIVLALIFRLTPFDLGRIITKKMLKATTFGSKIIWTHKRFIPMQNIISWLEKALHLTPDLEVKILSSIFIVVFLWVLRILVVQLINHQLKDLRQRYYWRKTLSYLIGILGLFLVGRTWLIGRGILRGGAAR